MNESIEGIIDEKIALEPKTENISEIPIELELKELEKSDKPINIVDGTIVEHAVEVIRPWNDYTMVLNKGGENIRIFDENAKLIKAFDLPLCSRRIRINWKAKVRDELHKNYVCSDRKAQFSNEMGVDEIPLGIMPCLKKKISYEGSRLYVDDYCSTDEFMITELVVLFDKYIALITPEGVFSIFITKNEQGITLAPRNWQRPDPFTKLPVEVDKTMKQLLKEKGTGYKQINESYYASVNAVGVNIMKTGDNSLAFYDKITSVGDNVVPDFLNPNIVYYCQTDNPQGVARLDISGDSNSWKPIMVKFPQKYKNVHDFQLDPSGNFFIFYAEESLVIVNKETLEEVKKVPGLTHVNFDSQGKIHAVDKDNHLVIYETNLSEFAQEFDKRRVAKLAEEIKFKEIFETNKVVTEAEQNKKSGDRGLEYLAELRTKSQEQFSEVLASITTQEGACQIRQSLDNFEEELRQKGLKPNEITYIVEGLKEVITDKEKEFAIKNVQEALIFIRAKLASGLSIASISEVRVEMEKIRVVEALLTENLQQEVREVALEFEQKSLELFQQRGGEIIQDIKGLVARTKIDLEGFTNKFQMDDWLEFRYPQLKARLSSLLKDTPLEADEAYKAIVAARQELQTIASAFEDKFKQEYAKVREKAAERTEATTGILVQDIEGFIERFRTKSFIDRSTAEQYLSSSEAYKTLKTEIGGMASVNPDIAKGLERDLKVRIANALTEIERGARTQVAETGQQMVLFGRTNFPKWEAKVKEKIEYQADVIFEEDVKTHGSGVKAEDILGDVSILVHTSTGKAEKVRLYEGWSDENEWRLGLLTYQGKAIPPSYVPAKEFKDIKKRYTDWSQGEKSSLRKELQEKREALKELYSQRQKGNQRTPEVDEPWRDLYKQKLQEYGIFAAANNIPLLRRIDQIKQAPEIEYTNGKGFIPQWQNHWVMDHQTEVDLEEMAKALKMQLDLQEGLLNLKGHAGTGKDVRIKMFCSLTNRPYFGIDGTKWTTEFELSEDVMLESKEGASQTVKVPSAVLNGITTPGAVVYFNEFNAMPEQAQIFLHALMDEKRSLTLKTSSGKTIHALPSVLLVSSMNPGYPGTFEPQFATRSRMVSVEIGYPPLTRQPDKGDSNPNLPYDASEALRIARGIDSLVDLTYEASIEHNEFVKMWDKYINGIDNGAQEPTGTQKFDIDVSLALVQFANILRENFIKIFEKSRDAHNALPVSQPITGRELRRAAYALSKMSPEEKATANPESVARDLLDKYFLTHIDNNEDQNKIRLAMRTWTSKKRVRA
jgi:hypothetical protein